MQLLARPTFAAICGAFVFSFFVFEAESQNLLSLEQWSARPADQREESYPYVRCAGYYKGTLEYIGPSNLPKHAADQNHKASTLLAALAIKIRKARRVRDQGNFVDSVISDINQIADFYYARMKHNYAATGQAFYNDPLMMSDMLACKNLAEKASTLFR